MDRTELLTWLGVIVGIPGLLLPIFGKEWAAGILGVLLVLAFVWFYLRLNQPPFTLEEVAKTVTFKDATGADASVSRPQTAVNNHLATEFWVRGLSSDGRIENIRIDGKPPDEVRTEMGKYHICKRFNHPLKPRTKFKLHIEYDLKDSFPGLHFESLLHSADIRTKRITLEVRFGNYIHEYRRLR